MKTCQLLMQIRNAAKENAVGVGITAFTKGKQYPQNSIFVIDRNGDIIMKYSKVHTCDFDWEQYLESGEAFNTREILVLFTRLCGTKIALQMITRLLLLIALSMVSFMRILIFKQYESTGRVSF